MHVIWPPAIAGPVVVLIGIAAVFLRAKLADQLTQISHSTNGAWKGTTKPWMVLVGATAAIATGVSMFLGGLNLI